MLTCVVGLVELEISLPFHLILNDLFIASEYVVIFGVCHTAA